MSKFETRSSQKSSDSRNGVDIGALCLTCHSLPGFESVGCFCRTCCVFPYPVTVELVRGPGVRVMLRHTSHLLIDCSQDEVSMNSRHISIPARQVRIIQGIGTFNPTSVPIVVTPDEPMSVSLSKVTCHALHITMNVTWGSRYITN